MSVKNQSSYFSQRRAPVGNHLTSKGRDIPFEEEVKYLCVISDSRVTWRQHIDSIDTKDLRTFIRIYSLLKSERLRAKSKLTLHKALM